MLIGKAKDGVPLRLLLLLFISIMSFNCMASQNDSILQADTRMNKNSLIIDSIYNHNINPVIHSLSIIKEKQNKFDSKINNVIYFSISFFLINALLIVMVFIKYRKSVKRDEEENAKPNNFENNYSSDKDTPPLRNDNFTTSELTQIKDDINELKKHNELLIKFLESRDRQAKNKKLETFNIIEDKQKLFEFRSQVQSIKSQLNSSSINYKNIINIENEIDQEIQRLKNLQDNAESYSINNPYEGFYNSILLELRPDEPDSNPFIDFEKWIMALIEFYENEMVSKTNRDMNIENSKTNKLLKFSEGLAFIVPKPGDLFDSKIMRVYSEKESRFNRGEVVIVNHRGIVLNNEVIKKAEVIISK